MPEEIKTALDHHPCSYCNLPHRFVDDPGEMCDVCYESMMDGRRDALEYIDLDDDYDIEESEEEE